MARQEYKGRYAERTYNSLRVVCRAFCFSCPSSSSERNIFEPRFLRAHQRRRVWAWVRVRE